MKYFRLFLAVLLWSGCQKHNLEINGTAQNIDGATVSILDLSDKTLDSTLIKSGKFNLIPKNVEKAGYYTFSVMFGKYPNDFEIYLEPGKYDVGIPEKAGDYLVIKTTSKIQNELSAYYTFEDSVIYPFRHTIDSLNAAIADPKGGDVYGLMKKVASARARANGATTAIMDMFVTKYPKNTIIPHIISVEDYKSNPFPYYYVFQRLSPEVKNSEEGKKIGKTLDSLNKVQNEQIKKPMPVKAG